MVNAAEFPDAGICCQLFLVGGDEFWQVDAAGLFFAFDEEFYIARQFTIGGKQGIDGIQTGGDVALVIADTASIQFAFAQGWFERWCLPQV